MILAGLVWYRCESRGLWSLLKLVYRGGWVFKGRDRPLRTPHECVQMKRCVFLEPFVCAEERNKTQSGAYET
jgi:hypothetical protein